jgi:hypothetical protein
MLEHMVNLSTASKYEREKYIMTLESQSWVVQVVPS